MTDAAEGVKINTKGGQVHNITAQGWNAFKK
jgi:thiamine-monophosphate kinase